MPVRNEGQFLKRAIESILVAGRALMSFEIIVVDGMSDDDTRSVVAELQREDHRILLLENTQRTVPHAMNIGILAASADVIVRVDGHAEVYPDFLVNSLAELAAHPECACVGGPIENVALDQGSTAVSLAMGSRFGVGNVRFRTGGEEGYVDTLAFGAYRKSDLIEVGLFDEDLVRNQDDEMNFRLNKAGRRIWFSKSLRSRYVVRSSLPKLFRQYFQYGYWKVYVNRKHGQFTNLRQLIPPLLVVSLAGLALSSPFLVLARVLLVVELFVYLATALFFALRLTTGARAVFAVVKAFITLHGSYGLGYLAGVRDFLLLRRPPQAGATELSR
jgi:glycosyltransferase involved in cell wall biosynthesis